MQLDRKYLVLFLSISMFILAIYLEFFGVILSLIILLFLPGYSLAAVFFPEKDLDTIDRIILSIGLSIAIIPLLGLALSFSQYGFFKSQPPPFLTILLILSLIFSIAAYLRRGHLIEKKALFIDISRPNIKKSTFILISMILIVVIGIIYQASIKDIDRLTEFYILNQDGKAADYPLDLKDNSSGSVIIGITNYEDREQNYSIQIENDGRIIETFSVVLQDKERIERRVTFKAETIGRHRLDFLLYKGSDMEPYRALHLWVFQRGTYE